MLFIGKLEANNKYASLILILFTFSAVAYGHEISRDPASLQSATHHQRQHSKSPRAVTPPERKGLPTPPATIDVERNPPSLPPRLLEPKRRAEASDIDSLTVIPISPAEYASASEQIESAFRRVDYEPKHGRIILRMPFTVHETFIAELVRYRTEDIKTRSRQQPSQ